MEGIGKKLTVTFEGKLAECIRRQCSYEGVSQKYWVQVLVEKYLLEGTGYNTVDELYNDNYKD